MKLLALDQATKVTGYSVFEDGKLVSHGLIKANQQDIGARLLYIKTQIIKLIIDNNIEEVVFEDIQLQETGSNPLAFRRLSELYGVLEETFTEIKIPHSSVLAVQWKNGIGIKGKKREEQKKNTQLYVKEKYGLEVSEDESDSIGIGTFYSMKDTNDWTK